MCYNQKKTERMKFSMKIGILGPGKIARTVAPVLAAMPEIQCYAAASRSLEKAEAFAKEFGFEKAYGSYEQMLCDPAVELVYVATPHSHHFQHIRLCLEHGKHVICEKAFTMNAQQAREVKALAEEKKLYLAEAIWTRYMPSRQIIQQVIDSGVIGKLNTLTANLSYDMDTKKRIMEPALAGGALLDIGVYGLNFALMHFGWDFSRMDSSVRLTETGVDGMETVTLHYTDGRMAVLTHSVYCVSDRKGIFHGETGYIVVENVNNPQSVSVFDAGDNLVARYDCPHAYNGYEYEFQEAVRCIREGKIQSDSMPLSESVRVMELMDSLRKQWGVVYPQEME